MNFALVHKSVLFSLAAIAVLPLILSGETGIYLGPVVGLMWIVGLGLPERWMKKPVFRTVATFTVATLFVIQVIRVGAGMHLAVATIEFATLLLAVKLCMRSEFGDFQQIVLLSFVAQIASTVTSYQLSYGFFFAGFVVLAPFAMFLTQLRKEMEVRFTKANSYTRQRLLQSTKIVQKRLPAIPLLGTVSLLAVISLLFLSIPRWGFGIGGGGLIGNPMPGFTDEVQIGDLSETIENNNIYMRLWPKYTSDKPGRSLNLKFRGAVFDTYRDGKWQHHKGDRGFHYFTSRNGRYSFFVHPQKATASYQIMQKSTDPPFLFIPVGADSVQMEAQLRRGRTRFNALRINANGVLKYNDPRKVGIRYTANISGSPLPNWPIENFRVYLQLPEHHERIRRLAEEWTRGSPSVQTQVNRIVVTFQQQFGYAKTVSALARASSSESDVLHRFLFSYRKGTCEHFATAATLMFRTLNIPARFVTGFQGAKWNDIGEYYTVDASMAHAWTEIYYNGRWHTVDATPVQTNGNSVVLAEKPPYLRQFMDTLEMKWHQYVIDYNETTQQNLLSQVLLPNKGQRFHRPRFSISQTVLATLILVIFSIFVIFKRKQLGAVWRQFRRQSGPPRSSATALYLKLETELGRISAPRPASKTPKQFLEQMAQQHPLIATFLQEFSDAYLAERFGGHTMSPDMRRIFSSRIAGISKQLQKEMRSKAGG
ncbi:MAG: DUF3488 domain-containing protein [Deltaproteobacteria bacterium]|nr:DUF3488 domain-containing protein [Deltaproteobacteria bacterium]